MLENLNETVTESTKEESIAKEPTRGYLLKFSLPTILSMLIMSTFGIVDGIFVSRIIDPIALSAVGIVFPFISFVMAIGFMLGVGGNALVAKKIGMGLEKEARENFSLITLVAFIASLTISLIGILFPSFILNILGANDFVYHMAMEYMQPLLYFIPAITLGMVFQQFLITIGKAHYSAIMSLISGSIGVGLNYLLIYVLEMGLRGAAIATAIAYTLPALVGLAYFTFKRSGTLYLIKPKADFRALGKACVNGSSEMVTMLAVSVTTVVMNNVLIDLAGAEAIAAAGIMFAGFGIFSALFIGYSSGIAPIISYNYGKNDTKNLKKAYSNSLGLIGIITLVCVGLAWLSTSLIISVYDVPIGTPIHEMAYSGFRILILSFVFAGFNIFASMLFTALNNGLISAMLSLFRTLIFVIIAFVTLPAIFGLTGAWLAMPFAEVLGIVMTIVLLRKMKSVYRYA